MGPQVLWVALRDCGHTTGGDRLDTSRLDLAPNSLTYARSLTLMCVSVEFGGPVSPPASVERSPWRQQTKGSQENIK
jgi:hypothetical protein